MSNVIILKDELQALVNKYQETKKPQYLLTAIKIARDLGRQEAIDERFDKSHKGVEYYYYTVEKNVFDGLGFVPLEQKDFKDREVALECFNQTKPDTQKGEQVRMVRNDVSGRHTEKRIVRKKGATIHSVQNML